MPHQGRHPNKYHEYVLQNMRDIDNFAQGDKDVFLGMFEDVKREIVSNPNMLYKDYWRNR